MIKHIRLLGMTAAEWALEEAAGEILKAREPGLLLSAGGAVLELRVGDGTKKWSELTDILGGGSTPSQTPWLTKTTTEMNAVVGPTEGMAVWNTTEHQLMVYDGSAWVGIPMLA